MATGLQHQKKLVESGEWLLYRFHPDRGALQLDSRALAAQHDVDARWKLYNHPAAMKNAPSVGLTV